MPTSTTATAAAPDKASSTASPELGGLERCSTSAQIVQTATDGVSSRDASEANSDPSPRVKSPTKSAVVGFAVGVEEQKHEAPTALRPSKTPPSRACLRCLLDGIVPHVAALSTLPSAVAGIAHDSLCGNAAFGEFCKEPSAKESEIIARAAAALLDSSAQRRSRSTTPRARRRDTQATPVATHLEHPAVASPPSPMPDLLSPASRVDMTSASGSYDTSSGAPQRPPPLLMEGYSPIIAHNNHQAVLGPSNASTPGSFADLQTDLPEGLAAVIPRAAALDALSAVLTRVATLERENAGLSQQLHAFKESPKQPTDGGDVPMLPKRGSATSLVTGGIVSPTASAATLERRRSSGPAANALSRFFRRTSAAFMPSDGFPDGGSGNPSFGADDASDVGSAAAAAPQPSAVAALRRKSTLRRISVVANSPSAATTTGIRRATLVQAGTPTGADANNTAAAAATTRRALVGAPDIDGSYTVNDYVVLDTIGRGTQGEVHLAFDNHAGEFRAIKAIQRPKAAEGLSLVTDVANGCSPRAGAVPVALSRQRQRTTQLRREVAIMKKLRHPNIVRLHEVIDDPEQDTMYLVMQFVDHGSLATVNRSGKLGREPIPPAELARYAEQIVGGLRYLHRRGIIHRDVKPDNVLLGQNDQVYLTDFGMSETFAGKDPLHGDGGDVTPTSAMIAAASAQSTNGTIAYMSPELLSSSAVPGSTGGRAATPAVDVWALGVTLYALLYGQLPWRNATTLMGAMDDICNATIHVPPPTEPDNDDEQHGGADGRRASATSTTSTDSSLLMRPERQGTVKGVSTEPPSVNPVRQNDVSASPDTAAASPLANTAGADDAASSSSPTSPTAGFRRALSTGTAPPSSPPRPVRDADHGDSDRQSPILADSEARCSAVPPQGPRPASTHRRQSYRSSESSVRDAALPPRRSDPALQLDEAWAVFLRKLLVRDALQRPSMDDVEVLLAPVTRAADLVLDSASQSASDFSPPPKAGAEAESMRGTAGGGLAGHSMALDDMSHSSVAMLNFDASTPRRAPTSV